MDELDRELEEMANRHLEAPVPPPPSMSVAAGARTAAKRSQAPLGSVDDRNLAVGVHLATLAAAVFSGGLLDILVPTTALVLFRERGAFLQDHVKEQLNFQLTMLIVALGAIAVSVLTLGIGLLVAVPVVVGFFVADIVCSIQATLAASRGERYAFPASIRFLR